MFFFTDSRLNEMTSCFDVYDYVKENSVLFIMQVLPMKGSLLSL